MKLLKIIAYLIILLLAIIPILYILIFRENSLSFTDFSGFMRSIGKILGLVGIILFSLVFLLNTRLRIFEKIFNGLDQVYRIHHNLGTIAFILILFHPIFLSSQFLTISLKAAVEFFYPFQSIPKTLGIFSLALMIIFLIFTFFFVFKYQNWKFTHRLLGVSFILASLHILLIRSDVSSDTFLIFYIGFFILLGISCYSYRTLFWKLLVKRYDYKIKSIRILDKISEITLEPLNSAIKFKPGQFIFISVDSEAVTKEPHPFTISSSKSNKNIILSIKNLGDYTGKLKELKEGQNVKVEGPYGNFSLENYSSRDYILIAGGIGITPFLSMIRSISDAPEKFSFDSIDFYYSVKNEKEAVFLEEIKKISKKLPQDKKLNIINHTSDKEGYVTTEYILNHSKNIKKSVIFICGPLSMMESLKKQLVSNGISKNKIITEDFALL